MQWVKMSENGKPYLYARTSEGLEWKKVGGQVWRKGTVTDNEWEDVPLVRCTLLDVTDAGGVSFSCADDDRAFVEALIRGTSAWCVDWLESDIPTGVQFGVMHWKPSWQTPREEER